MLKLRVSSLEPQYISLFSVGEYDFLAVIELNFYSGAKSEQATFCNGIFIRPSVFDYVRSAKFSVNYFVKCRGSRLSGRLLCFLSLCTVRTSTLLRALRWSLTEISPWYMSFANIYLMLPVSFRLPFFSHLPIFFLQLLGPLSELMCIFWSVLWYYNFAYLLI